MAILFVFKYYGFTINFLNKILGLVGVSLNLPLINVLLPVGISFYTFQALGYIVDVYRGEIKAERNFINYALFVSFFPQLVAGPIERSKNLLTQIDNLGHRRYENLSKGLLYILWGFFLKLVIADRAAIFVNQVYDSYQGYSYIFYATPPYFSRCKFIAIFIHIQSSQRALPKFWDTILWIILKRHIFRNQSQNFGDGGTSRYLLGLRTIYTSL